MSSFCGSDNDDDHDVIAKKALRKAAEALHVIASAIYERGTGPRGALANLVFKREKVAMTDDQICEAALEGFTNAAFTLQELGDDSVSILSCSPEEIVKAARAERGFGSANPCSAHKGQETADESEAGGNRANDGATHLGGSGRDSGVNGAHSTQDERPSSSRRVGEMDDGSRPEDRASTKGNLVGVEGGSGTPPPVDGLTSYLRSVLRVSDVCTSERVAEEVRALTFMERKGTIADVRPCAVCEKEFRLICEKCMTESIDGALEKQRNDLSEKCAAEEKVTESEKPARSPYEPYAKRATDFLRSKLLRYSTHGVRTPLQSDVNALVVFMKELQSEVVLEAVRRCDTVASSTLPPYNSYAGGAPLQVSDHDLKCLVKGCENHTSIIGVVCSPCRKMLTSGNPNSGATFIHEAFARQANLAARLRELAEQAAKGT